MIGNDGIYKQTCRNRTPLTAEVAKILPSEPKLKMTREAAITVMSANKIRITVKIDSIPIRQIGFLMNLKRPQSPMYLERHPALHTLRQYSIPKNTTRNTS